MPINYVAFIDGIFTDFDLTQAFVHDFPYLKNIKLFYRNCTVIADKRYLNIDYQIDFFSSKQIELEISIRRNLKKNYTPQAYIFRKSRKRIETLFSQLYVQFMIRRNYSKTFERFKTRLIAKITALTFVQFINKEYFNRNINKLKVSKQKKDNLLRLDFCSCR